MNGAIAVFDAARQRIVNALIFSTNHEAAHLMHVANKKACCLVFALRIQLDCNIGRNREIILRVVRVSHAQRRA